MSSISVLHHQEEEYKHTLVDSILAARNYYEVLGLPPDASPEMIRKAYIKKSRVCHPDKFKPSCSKATEGFQVLSTAYNTLVDPSRRSRYDAYQKMGMEYRPSYRTEENNVDILQDVIIQLYSELAKGEFHTLRTVIHTVNEATPLISISDYMLTIIEGSISRVRNLLLASRRCHDIVQLELSSLRALRNEMESLPYLDIQQRLSLTLAMVKKLLKLTAFLKPDEAEAEKVYRKNCV